MVEWTGPTSLTKNEASDDPVNIMSGGDAPENPAFPSRCVRDAPPCAGNLRLRKGHCQGMKISGQRLSRPSLVSG